MTSRTLAFIISATLIGSALAWTRYAPHTSAQQSTVSAAVIERDGTQYITLLAKSGYHPKELTVRADTPTELTFVTDNTFDCSSSVTIPTLTYTTQLPATGTTTVALGTHKAGDIVTGGCSVSSYGFKIRFE